MSDLHVDSHGEGGPTLLLLHGLGVHGAVWQPFIAELQQASGWPGRILVPDFAGHGYSPRRTHYDYEPYARDIADLIHADAGDAPVHIVGHSMGGMIGLMLASGRFGVRVASIFGFGVKVSWREGEAEGLRAIAAKPARLFASRAEAAERFIRVAGLSGLVTADDAMVARGIMRQDDGWQLAADPAVMSVVGLPLDGVWQNVRPELPVRLACGSRDPLTSLAEARAFDPAAAEIAGCGHNPHVEAPADVVRLFAATRPLRT